MKRGKTISALALTVLMIPGAVAAQRPATSLDDLVQSSQLRPGDGVYVTDSTGRRIKGTVSDVSSAMLQITDGQDSWTLDEGEVNAIELQDSVENGIWIGIGVAIAGTFAMCGIEGTDNGACYGTLYAFWPTLGAGAGLGWYLDSRINKTLYQKSGGGRLSVSPLVSTERYGATASLSW